MCIMNRTTFTKITVVIYLFLSISCCELFNTWGPDGTGRSDDTGEEPEYTLKIAWESDTKMVENSFSTMDNDAVYLFDGAALDSFLMGSILVKLDAQTGRIVWKRDMLNAPQFTSPIVIENYVYVHMSINGIYCFDKRDGTLVAKSVFDIDNQSLEIYRNITKHENFLYFGIGNGNRDNYFARVDTNSIEKDGGKTEQFIEAEVIWHPVYDGAVVTEPAFHSGIVYIHSSGSGGYPAELAGINMTTKSVEFYKEFGLNDDDEYYDNGWNYHSLYTHDDILYYIGSSISAYKLNTADRKCLYLKTFSYETPEKEAYGSNWHIDATFYSGRIYYTSGDSNPFGDHDYRNIHCINAKTGNLVWNDISKNSESHGTNPIIAHNRMYVPEGNGLRVYNAETGRLIGVDRNFSGTASGRNFLYGDLMLTVRRGHKKYTMVAIDVSK